MKYFVLDGKGCVIRVHWIVSLFAHLELPRCDGEWYCMGSPLSAMDLYGMGGQGSGKVMQQVNDPAHRGDMSQVHAVANISDDRDKSGAAKTMEVICLYRSHCCLEINTED